jgi:hypothetical protein
MPAKAGIQKTLNLLDSRLSGNDTKGPDDEKIGF